MKSLLEMAFNDIRFHISRELNLLHSLRKMGSPYGIVSTAWIILRLSRSSLFVLIPLALFWKCCWYALLRPVLLLWTGRAVGQFTGRSR